MAHETLDLAIHNKVEQINVRQECRNQTAELEHQVRVLKHELQAVPLERNRYMLVRPENDRKDQTIRMSKELRTSLNDYFTAVVKPIYSSRRFNTRMRPLNREYEIDGIEIQLPNSDEANRNYYKMPMRAIMERNLERRIRHVKVLRGNRIWITLWQRFSKFDTHLYRCINRYINNLVDACGTGTGSVYVKKLDCKIDYAGSFVWPTRAANYPSILQKAVRQGARWYQANQEGTQSDFDWSLFDEQDSDNRYYEDKIRVLKGFDFTETFLSYNVSINRKTLFTIKRYDKVSEMAQKSTVGQSIGCRIGRLVG